MYVRAADGAVGALLLMFDSSYRRARRGASLAQPAGQSRDIENQNEPAVSELGRAGYARDLDERIVQGFHYDLALARDAIDKNADRCGAGADHDHVFACGRARLQAKEPR